MIQSFSAESLQRIHELRPEIPLVQLLRAGDFPMADARLDEVANYAVAIGPPFGNVDADLVARSRARCLDVHPYTVDDPATTDSLLTAGVGGMFTNGPDLPLDRSIVPPDLGTCDSQ